MGLVSVFTATIASALTERRLKEARGLEQITSAGHTLICGWNSNAEGVIQNLVALGALETGDIVMVNNLPEDQVQEIILRLQNVHLRYVHGDFALEGALRKANVENAVTVILLADIAGGDRAKADERTILGTLTIKSINRDVKVCAQLLSKDNEQHLRRAGADEIVIVGEFTGFLIASAAQLPGLNSVVRELMVDEAGNSFHRMDVPEEFRGRAYLDLLLHFRREFGATLIGIVSEEKGMTMDEMLTDSAIDNFIRAKFAEAGKESLFQVGGGSQVRVNLPDDYQIGENDHAIVIMQGKVES
jgi:voltage-gated potassium channel